MVSALYSRPTFSHAGQCASSRNARVIEASTNAALKANRQERDLLPRARASRVNSNLIATRFGLEGAARLFAVHFDAGWGDNHHGLAEAGDITIDVRDELLQVACDAAENHFVVSDL
jgi:hypothetical protein